MWKPLWWFCGKWIRRLNVSKKWEPELSEGVIVALRSADELQREDMVIQPLGFGDQLGVWDLVEGCGKEESRVFLGFWLRQNWMEKGSGKREELRGEMMFSVICLVSGACGGATYRCLVGCWILLGWEFMRQMRFGGIHFGIILP